MSEFLVNNRLKLNDDKTHLLVLTTSQTRRRAGGFENVVISTPAGDISPTPVEKLLGAWIHQDLKWSEHLQNNDESLVRALTTRLSAIKMVCKVATFQTRKMIADGLFISKLSYLISAMDNSSQGIACSMWLVECEAAGYVSHCGAGVQGAEDRDSQYISYMFSKLQKDDKTGTSGHDKAKQGYSKTRIDQQELQI